MTANEAPDLEAVNARVRAAGLVPRGAFHCEPGDGVPVPAATLVLVGTAGPDGFDAFRASAEWCDAPDPLDRFTERVLEGLARALGAVALYPHRGPPWLPFQRWAARAEAVAPSPIGILMHPEHGLWHAYRGALGFAARLSGVSARGPLPDICGACDGRPCLSACPVNAFTADGYDVAACAAHLASPAGRRCLQEGCLARGACPVAPHARYGPEQVRFHMRAFARARGVEVGREP